MKEETRSGKKGNCCCYRTPGDIQRKRTREDNAEQGNERGPKKTVERKSRSLVSATGEKVRHLN